MHLIVSLLMRMRPYDLHCLFSTFRRHLCAASSGVVSPTVRWTHYLEPSWNRLQNFPSLRWWILRIWGQTPYLFQMSLNLQVCKSRTLGLVINANIIRIHCKFSTHKVESWGTPANIGFHPDTALSILTQNDRYNTYHIQYTKVPYATSMLRLCPEWQRKWTNLSQV